jgi:hypothetical protein
VARACHSERRESDNKEDERSRRIWALKFQWTQILRLRSDTLRCRRYAQDDKRDVIIELITYKFFWLIAKSRVRVFFRCVKKMHMPKIGTLSLNNISSRFLWN